MEDVNKQRLFYNGNVFHKINKSLSVFICCSMRKQFTSGCIFNQISFNRTFPLPDPLCVCRRICSAFWNWYWAENVFDTGWIWAKLKWSGSKSWLKNDLSDISMNDSKKSDNKLWNRSNLKKSDKQMR